MSVQTAAPTLYEQLGGAEAIGAVVDDFYARVLADDGLRPVFAGVDMNRLRHHQARFIGYALGGPNQYAGRSMRVAHAGLGISAAQFAAVAGHLTASLGAFAVPSHLIDQVIAHVARLKGDVVAE
jgi:hemoglobin